MSDLDAIRDRVDIVELVGETVRLQRAGRTYKGLCPFHTEKTPSFIVSPDRRSWHCFGSCSTGGDVFSFVMRRDNLDFGEALRQLAARAGVALESSGRQRDEHHSRLFDANADAARYFHNALLNSTEGAAARRYAEQRGLDRAAIEAFEIGYAPDAWEALTGNLRSKGFTDPELVESGLLIEGERGSHDRFRGRLMFPIRDIRSQVVGFGGRALGEAVPKYLNSPQSPIFDKGGLLYALDRAANSIRHENQAVIVEGYLDAITAHQFGFTNVVATLGTALGERHIALLKRYARSVALALDADEAGVQAAARGEQLIREMSDDQRAEVVVDWGNLVRVQSRAPVDVRIFSVPAGKDPDEAIRAEPAAWTDWVAGALPPFEFRLKFELARLDRANPRQRLELLDRLLPLLADVGDRTLQAQYLSQLALSLGIREEDVRLRLNASLPSSRRGTVIVTREAGRATPAAPAALGARTEAFCLALLLRFEQLRKEGLGVSADWFTSTPHRQLFQLWSETEAVTEDDIPEELRAEWRTLAEMRLMAAVEVDPDLALRDCLGRMQMRRLELQKRLLTATLATPTGEDEASEAGEDEQSGSELDATLRDDIELARQLHELEYRLRTGKEPPLSLQRFLGAEDTAEAP